MRAANVLAVGGLLSSKAMAARLETSATGSVRAHYRQRQVLVLQYATVVGCERVRQMGREREAQPGVRASRMQAPGRHDGTSRPGRR